MKNLIEPKILAALSVKPVSLEGLSEFLASEPSITASQLCRLVEVDPQNYYRWKHLKVKNSAGNEGGNGGFSVEPISGKGKKYAPTDKFNLVNQYLKLDDTKRAEFLRKFGLYQSDVARWRELIETAAVDALSTRKPRSDKKSGEQIELENLKRETKAQEKTIAKLAALVVIQKKVSEILNPIEED